MLKNLFYIITVSSCFIGCSIFRETKPTKVKISRTQITAGRHLFPSDTKNSTIVGIYNQILDYSTKPPYKTNRVQILLKDGFGIVLATNSNGIRSRLEIKKHLNKQVIVTGLLDTNCKIALDPYFSSFSIPCLKNIENITLQKNNYN